MISFITLSTEPEAAAERLSANLREVFEPEAGDAFEVVAVDGNGVDIFRGFDEGARRAKGDVLGFVHDDITFECNRRAFDRVLPLLNDGSTGIVGVAGSKLVPPHGCWWKANREFLRGSVMHDDTNAEFNVHLNCWPGGSAALYGEVAVVDGCFMMIGKKVFDQLGGFGAAGLSGFHFYDIDLSMRARLAGFRNYVAPISILHSSVGVLDAAWDRNRLLFCEKYTLPYRI
jgi:GT2 family glycosyltransferase